MNTKVHVKKKRFPGIEKNPSLLGFGCMRFPLKGEDTKEIDEERAEEMLDYAYEHGVDYFDTAWPYHGGASEPFMGKVLKKYPRESFHLVTKMPGWEVESAEDAERIFHEQLEKCQVDYFDYYLCHSLNKKGFETYKLPGVMEFLERMKKEGKIRHLGFSFHDTPEVLEEIINYRDWDFVQLQVNYLDWDFQDAKRQYEIVKEKGLPVIVMEPVRGGTLAELSEEAREILKEKNPEASIASWAIRYVAGLENVLVVLSGMSDMEQTKDNVKTLSDFHPLDEEEQKVLDKALNVFLEKRIIPCTECAYCMPCPEGVDIPRVFHIYNQYAISQNKRFFIHFYEKLEEEKRAEECISCGVCLDKCPQKIDIPARMEEIRDLYGEIKKELETEEG